MSPGSPDASDELQVIPRRTSDGSPSPSSRPPPTGPSTPPAADPARRKRLTRIVAIALGGCGFILVAAVIARAARPREAAPAPGASSSAQAAGPSSGAASATSAPSAAPAASTTTTAAPAAPPAPTTGTVVFDRPAAPGKVWIDGKKISSRSVDIPCGTHKIKIGYGKTKSVTLTCGAELHLSR